MMEFENRRKMSTGLVLMILSVFIFSACSKSSSPDEVASLAQAPTPPAGGGAFTISTNGGNGTNGSGSNGGTIDINAPSLQVLNVDTPFDNGFTVPTDPKSLGPNPRLVTGNETIVLDDGTVGTCNKDVFGGTGEDALVGGTTGAALSTEPATGLDVAAGVTLTLTPDPDCFDIDLEFMNDVIIDGTLSSLVPPAAGAPAGTLGTRVNIFLGMGGNFFSGPNSVIDNSGFDSATGGAGSGRSFSVGSVGKIVSQGAVDTSGGNATGTAANSGSGGNAGGVSFDTSFGIYSTGAINAHGGSAVEGAGGNGAFVGLFADNNNGAGPCDGFGGIGISADINSSGGDGSEGGGNAGGIAADAVNCSQGDLRSTANYLANGGNATIDGNGGNGAPITFDAEGFLGHKGEIHANGGNGAGVVLVGLQNNGGAPGSINIDNTCFNVDCFFDEVDPDRGTSLTGNMSADAGSGENGGVTGFGAVSISISTNAAHTRLFNYSGINNIGGNGAGGNGGAGGNTDISGGFGFGGFGGIAGFGDLRTEVNYNNSGGNGTGLGSNGGPGGLMDLAASNLIAFGTFQANGGSGASFGAGGGDLMIGASFRGFVEGTAEAKGGAGTDATLTTGGGADGGIVAARGSRVLEANLAVDVSGASGAIFGGDGGGVSFSADNHLTTTGNITSNGAGATRTTSNGDALALPPIPDTRANGDGGLIELATKEEPTDNTGTLSILKGTGTGTAALDGVVIIDGFNVN